MEKSQIISFLNKEIPLSKLYQSKYFCFFPTPSKILELVNSGFNASSYIVEQQSPVSDLNPRLIYIAKIFSEIYRSEISGDVNHCPYCCRKLTNSTIEKTNIGICWKCHIYTETGYNKIETISDEDVDKWAKIWICILEKRLQYLKPEFIVSQNKQYLEKIMAEWEDVLSADEQCDF